MGRLRSICSDDHKGAAPERAWRAAGARQGFSRIACKLVVKETKDMAGCFQMASLSEHVACLREVCAQAFWKYIYGF